MRFGNTGKLCETKITTQVTLSDLNDILILQLGRFNTNIQTNRRYKIQDAVSMNDEIVIQDKDIHKKYKLIAVIYHIGHTVEHGHYYCDCLKEEQWIRYDDSYVHHVPPYFKR